MARIFDVIEYANEMNDEIVHRFPEEGIGDFRIGSQVIVRESQTAVFFRDGNALDVFKPGRHTIATANIPMLIDFIGKAFNDRTPFPAEVYFVSRKEFANKKWGTPQPIIVRNPGMGLGVALLQGFGTYSLPGKRPAAVCDPDCRRNRAHIALLKLKNVCAPCCSRSCRMCSAKQARRIPCLK